MQPLSSRSLAIQQTIPVVIAESIGLSLPQLILNASSPSFDPHDKEMDVKAISQAVVMAAIVLSAATRIISMATLPSNLLMSRSEVRQLYLQRQAGRAAPALERKMEGAKAHCNKVNDSIARISGIALMIMTLFMVVSFFSANFFDDKIVRQLQAISIGLFLGIQFTFLGFFTQACTMKAYSHITRS